MASYNRVVLVGNLTKDIELRYTPGGTAVADVGLAVNDRRKSASGEWVEETTFVDITMWGRTAEVASEYLGKGSPILVEGRLKQESWETDGQKRSKLKVICERMQMLSSPGSSSSGGRQSGESGGSQRASGSSGNDGSDRDNAGAEGRSAGSNATSTAGQREAQPTGDGPGYDDPDIPF
ncbi:single-stranded DNA-binding protein [Rubripirellula amarantea]|nr:single-stranded DNA-binding protein [Rubripirellula amarantea]